MGELIVFEKFEQKEVEVDKSVFNNVIPPRERFLKLLYVNGLPLKVFILIYIGLVKPVIKGVMLLLILKMEIYIIISVKDIKKSYRQVNIG